MMDGGYESPSLPAGNDAAQSRIKVESLAVQSKTIFSRINRLLTSIGEELIVTSTAAVRSVLKAFLCNAVIEFCARTIDNPRR